MATEIILSEKEALTRYVALNPLLISMNINGIEK